MLDIASVDDFMQPSPARKFAPEPGSWIPIESLSSLPELEELLDPKYLVDSGQSRAVKVGEDGNGYVFVDSEATHALGLESEQKKQRSHMRWASKKRSLKLKKQAKLQKLFALVLIVLIIAGGSSYLLRKNAPATESIALQPKVSPLVSSFLPVSIPVVIEGKPSSIISTSSTLKEFVTENDLQDLVPMQKSFNRFNYLNKRTFPDLEFRYEKNISLKIGNESQAIKTTDLTVQEILNSNSIVVGGNDIVSPSLTSQAYGITEVSVTRVSTSTRSTENTIAFKTEKRNDPNLTRGKQVVARSGSAGVEKITYTQTIQNGAVASEVVSSRVVIKQPINQIISIGTKPLGTQQGNASWYSHIPGTCAHRTLPMGTIVTVRNNSTGATTTCKVADRGPFGSGRIIDLSKDVFANIAPTSKGIVGVTISW
ncbi:MAG: G5 domain-containing protein [Acidimicrobiia bacterium]